MTSPALMALIDQRLRDPNFTQINGNVSQTTIKAIRQSLMDMPDAALRDFLNSDYQIAVGNKAHFQNLFERHGQTFRADGQNVRAENAVMFDGRPTVIVRSDLPPERVRHVNTHEVGHAIDHINAGYSGYVSTNSPRFREAAENYLVRQANADHTIVMFDGDQSFRGQHYPNYNPNFVADALNGQSRGSLYKELTAEMFHKFSRISGAQGVIAADRFMSENYFEAWDAYKNEVTPQVGETVRNATAPSRERGPQQRSSTPEEQQVLRTLKDTLGEDVQGMRMRSSGDIEVRVPRGYSRGNFEALGIDNPRSVLGIQNFDRYAVITIPQEHASVITGIPNQLTQSQATANIRQTLGPDNVLGISVNSDAGTVSLKVEENFSRSNLAKIGVDPNTVQRASNGDGTHTIRFPANQLPPQFQVLTSQTTPTNPISQKEAITNITQTLGTENVLKVGINEANREALLQVPNTYSRNNLTQIGVDPSTVSRSEGPNGTSVLRVPADQLPPEFQVLPNQSGLKVANPTLDAQDIEPNKNMLGRAADWLGNLGKNGGFIAGVAIGVGVAGLTAASGANASEVGEAFVETAVPYGETAIDILIEQDTEAAAKSATIETASNVASVGGAAAGAALGATIGAGFFGIGAIPGAVIGGIIGSIGAGIGGAKVTEAVIENSEQRRDRAGSRSRRDSREAHREARAQEVEERTQRENTQEHANAPNDPEENVTIDIANIDLSPVEMPTFGSPDDDVDPGFVMQPGDNPTITIDMDDDGVAETFEVRPVEMPTFGPDDGASYAGDQSLLAQMSTTNLTIASELMQGEPTNSAPERAASIAPPELV